jgi:hypothetical protein
MSNLSTVEVKVESKEMDMSEDGRPSSLDEPEQKIPEGNIKLISKDKKEFTTSFKNASLSVVFKTTFSTDVKCTEIEANQVSGLILGHVIDYLNHQNGVDGEIIAKPLRCKKISECVKDQWCAEFIEKIFEQGRQVLYDLILAANYLDIKCLLNLGCAKVASLIKGQPLEKIKDILSTNSEEKKEEKK